MVNRVTGKDFGGKLMWISALVSSREGLSVTRAQLRNRVVAVVWLLDPKLSNLGQYDTVKR